jgi:phosphohistidine phosphatase
VIRPALAMAHLLCLLRHGIAEDPSASVRDVDRALTQEGVRKTELAAAGLSELGLAPDVILSSPLRRAVETAEIVARALGTKEAVRLEQALAGGEPEEILRGLRSHRGAACLLLVGHEPSLGILASTLLTGSPGLLRLHFKKAGVAGIAVGALPPSSPGELLWFLGPAHLRALGR